MTGRRGGCGSENAIVLSIRPPAGVAVDTAHTAQPNIHAGLIPHRHTAQIPHIPHKTGRVMAAAVMRMHPPGP